MFAQESVMEIKNKRKAFEQWFKTTGFYENAQDSAIYNEARFDVFDINNGFYRNRYVQLSWEAWQAATAQAVPEGFVLVPKDRLAKAVDGIEALFEDDCTLALGELLPIQQDLNAMIEAKEQNQWK